MENDGVKQGLKRPGVSKRMARRPSDAGVAVFLFVTATAGGTAILALPRPVAPQGTPGLHLDAAETAEILRRDARLADRAPKGADADALRELYAEYSRAEVDGTPGADAARRRMSGIRAATSRFLEAHGEDALAALRAEAVARLDDALAGRLDEGRTEALLGTFRSVLERYGAAREGEPTAPPFVVRTLFASRWNAAHGLPPTHGMEQAELRAYWGWLALEATGAPVERRLAALSRYAEAGGRDVLEARGALLFQAGEMLPAAEAFQQAYEEGGSVRLRNHALAALSTASGEW